MDKPQEPSHVQLSKIFKCRHACILTKNDEIGGQSVITNLQSIFGLVRVTAAATSKL